jgi:hypothetical protein
MVAFLWPGLPLDARGGLMPYHRYAGTCAYVLGLAAAAMGCQEKATFLQAFGKRGVRSGFVALPALAALLLAGVGLAAGVVLAGAGAVPAAARKQHVSIDDAESSEGAAAGLLPPQGGSSSDGGGRSRV